MRSYLMHMACPQCMLSGRSNREYWKHGECGGYLHVNDNGYVECDKCHKSSHITSMRVSCDCGKHIKASSSKKGWGGAVCTSSISDKDLDWIERFIKLLNR